jgi:hypothetical protein
MVEDRQKVPLEKVSDRAFPGGCLPRPMSHLSPHIPPEVLKKRVTMILPEAEPCPQLGWVSFFPGIEGRSKAKNYGIS